MPDTSAFRSTVDILLVDDRPENLLALEVVLSDLGENLVRAASGEEALGLLAVRDFAVVLLDVRMPGLSGFETAERMRATGRTRDTPVIFLSAATSDEFPVVEAYRLGAVDYLVKPLVPDIVRAKVAVFVDLFRKGERVRDLERRERQRAEAALRESEGRLRQLADNLPAGFIYQIVLTAGVGRFTFVSGGIEPLLGVTPEEVIADPTRLYGLIHEDDLPGMRAAEETALRAGEPFDHRFRTLARGGDMRWLHCRSAPRPLLDGGSVWDGIATDITDRVRAEEGLREQYRRKDEFMAMLAHELRNPLAPVRNSLHILQLRGGDPAVVERIREMMERQVTHLGRLVDDLLDVSRITTGKVQLRRERLDLARLVRQTVADHGAAFEAKGVSLVASMPAVSVWISGDPTRMAQVLDNLLANALKFTARGGDCSVSVTTDPDGRQAILAVRDTGAGIEPEVLGQLFEPFCQADRTLDRSRGGLGLGLAIVKGLTTLHGGAVRAESAGLGRGAVLTVVLPTDREPAALAAATAPPRPAPKRLRVLVVEDNKDSADSLRMLLEAYGYEVEVAYTGPDGVRAAGEHRPDVVICDIGLPGLDGYGVAAALRRNPVTADTRLIALTGYGQDEDRRRAKDAGFDEHLTKPADPTALEALLAAAS